MTKLRILSIIAAITGLVVFGQNFTHVTEPPRAIALAADAQRIQRAINDESRSADAREILRIQKRAVVDALILSSQLSSCEELLSAEPTLTTGLYSLIGERGERVLTLCDIKGGRVVRQELAGYETIVPGADCTFNGKRVAHGDYVNAFDVELATSPSICTPERRRCLDGNLTGAFPYSTCLDLDPGACFFNGSEIQNGQIATAYRLVTVGGASKCERATLNCDNGNLPGATEYPLSACFDGTTGRACTFDGIAVQHGGKIEAFLESESVTCRSVELVCLDGVVPGSDLFKYSSCSQR